MSTTTVDIAVDTWTVEGVEHYGATIIDTATGTELASVDGATSRQDAASRALRLCNARCWKLSARSRALFV